MSSDKAAQATQTKVSIVFQIYYHWVELYDCSYVLLIIPVVDAGILNPLRIQLNSAQLDPGINVQ